MNDAEVFHLERVRKVYIWSNKYLLPPDFYTETYGDMLHTYLKSMLKLSGNEETVILCGYHAKDVEMDINNFPNFFIDQNKSQHVITVNLLQFCLLQNAYLFVRSDDEKYCQYIFERYLQLTRGKCDAFALKYTYQWQKDDFTYSQFAAMISMTFCVFHECIHLNRNLFDSTLALLRTNINSFFNEEDEPGTPQGQRKPITDEQLKELACDFSALYLLVSPVYGLRNALISSFKCTVEDIVVFAYVTRHIKAIDAFFRLSEFVKASFNSSEKVQTIDSFRKTISGRLFNLSVAMKITKNSRNSGFDIGDLNLDKVSIQYGKFIEVFLARIEKSWKEIANKSKQYEDRCGTPPIFEKQQSLKKEDIWFRIG